MSALDWGTVPDWLVAAGTLGAFFTGFRLLSNESDRDQRRLEDEQATQARQVVAWCGCSGRTDVRGWTPRTGACSRS